MTVSVCGKRPVLSPSEIGFFEYQVDPYIGCEHLCHYCYALNQAETNWSKEILIHEDIAGQLSEELDQIPTQSIYLGYNSDPYQPCEAEYYQTRKTLELLLRKGFSAGILTKSDLVVRDIDLLKEMKGVSVLFSMAFNDNRTRTAFETKTISNEKRTDSLRQLKEAGIPTGAVISPVIPYITDVIPIIDILIPYVDDIWVLSLSIDDPSNKNWIRIKKILGHKFADLYDRIEDVVFTKDHIYWTQLRDKLTALKEERQLDLNIFL